MQKKTFKILDMHCSNCPMILESIEDDLVGVKQISASYARGTMVVEFDETGAERRADPGGDQEEGLPGGAVIENQAVVNTATIA